MSTYSTLTPYSLEFHRDIVVTKHPIPCLGFTVPSGYVSDGASIPVWLRWLCGDPLEEPRVYAAVVHDFIYDYHPDGYDRKLADLVYRHLLIVYGVSRWKAEIEYACIRLFGGSHWN